jgi:hypothetical protein
MKQHLMSHQKTEDTINKIADKKNIIYFFTNFFVYMYTKNYSLKIDYFIFYKYENNQFTENNFYE